MSCREFQNYSRLNLDVVGAQGDELVLRDGRRILDLYGGHCVNTLGAGHEELGRSLSEQWQELSFATNLLALDERTTFFEAFGARLPELAGTSGWQVFLSNSGAEANENALKVAFSATKRSRVVCFEGAFHGRTAAATAVTDTDSAGFPSPPFEVCRIPFGDVAAAEAAIDGETAACMLEPIQAMAGVVTPTSAYLEALRELCDASGALLLFDEVQTGSGRLGAPWASQAMGTVPDVFTTAKGAASGLPIGITCFRDAHAEKVEPGLFGSTFGGGPLVLRAAALVSRKVASGELLENVQATSRVFQGCAGIGPVKAVRGMGLLLGLEMVPGVSAREVQAALLEQGILAGGSADPRVLRLSPPLTLAPERALVLRGALESMEVAA